MPQYRTFFGVPNSLFIHHLQYRQINTDQFQKDIGLPGISEIPATQRWQEKLLPNFLDMF